MAYLFYFPSLYFICCKANPKITETPIIDTNVQTTDTNHKRIQNEISKGDQGNDTKLEVNNNETLIANKTVIELQQDKNDSVVNETEVN